MLKILLPCDGSANALRAVQYVIKLARAGTRVTVELVHVHEEPSLYGEIAVYVTRERMEALQQANAEAALAPAEKLLSEAGVAYTRTFLVGSVAQTIVDRAQRLGCDTIVLGTRGASALANLLMGSVTTKVVHLAAIPVTLIK